MIKLLPLNCPKNLLIELERYFNNNIVKDVFKIIKIVPIRKPNRDLNDIRNFRPISLL